MQKTDELRRWFATRPVARAFAVSITLHLLIFSLIEADRRYAIFSSKFLPAWMLPKPQETTMAMKALQKQQEEQVDREIPMLFVDVNPRTATQEPPKKAKFYSALNSEAASSETKKPADMPKIDGKQTQVIKATDVPRDRAKPLTAAAPPQPKEEARPPVAEATPPPVPRSGLEPGATAMLKPSPGAKKDLLEPNPTEPKPRERPRTLAQARMLKEEKDGGLAGEKMKQEGGSKKYALEASFDVRATAFGAYDAAIIAAIQKRWYDLLDESQVGRARAGKVVLSFKLKATGAVSDFKVEEYDVGEVLALICQRAISDPAPYEKWPSDMRRLVGSDTREVRFTFFYN